MLSQETRTTLNNQKSLDESAIVPIFTHLEWVDNKMSVEMKIDLFIPRLPVEAY